MISNIKIKNFQRHLTLKLFICLILELLKSNLIFFTRNNLFSLKFVISIFWQLFFEFALFFPFFPNKNCQVRKIQNLKNM
jgi:hypothetical protein